MRMFVTKYSDGVVDSHMHTPGYLNIINNSSGHVWVFNLTGNCVFKITCCSVKSFFTPTMASEAIDLLGPTLTCFRSGILLCLVRSQWMLLLTWYSGFCFPLCSWAWWKEGPPGIWATAQVELNQNPWLCAVEITQLTTLFPYQAHRPAGLLSLSICWARDAEPADLQGDKVTLEPFIPGLNSIAWLALHPGEQILKAKSW